MSAVTKILSYRFTKMRRHSGTSQLLLFIFCLSLFTSSFSCRHIDLYEKTVAIPQNEWRSSFQPSFSFDITDTTAGYNLYIVLRHNDAYKYNNLWLKLYTQPPGDSTSVVQFPLTLATNEKGWLGIGMDDIYEHRILISSPARLWHFRKKGVYQFRLQQIMRDDPLPYVMNAGLRIEKVSN